MDKEKVTANSCGKIVPGSKVMIPGNNLVFDVGEVENNIANLYINGKKVAEMPIRELRAI